MRSDLILHAYLPKADHFIYVRYSHVVNIEDSTDIQLGISDTYSLTRGCRVANEDEQPSESP